MIRNFHKFADSGLTGDRRLIIMALCDGDGVASIETMCWWSGLDYDECEKIVEEMVDDGIIVYWGMSTMNRHLYCWRDVWRDHINSENEIAMSIKRENTWSPSPSRRKYVYDRDDHKCVYCGSGDNLTIDHKVPRAIGGDHSVENLQTCCRSCNSKKGTKTHHEFSGEVSND